MQPYFIFNNINSTNYLIVNKLPSIYKPQKDVTKIEIPGRSGFLTQDNGSYKGILKTTECTLKNLDNIDFICSWLTGEGDVIFSNEPDKKYKATIINQIEYSKILSTFHSFIIQFDCQPHKYSINNDIITLTSAGNVFNPGTVESEPAIKVYGSGNIDLTINSATVHLTNVVDYVTIDSTLMDCYKDTTLQNSNMLGDFPKLQPGDNAVSWVGIVNKIEITPNWRWL